MTVQEVTLVAALERTANPRVALSVKLSLMLYCVTLPAVVSGCGDSMLDDPGTGPLDWAERRSIEEAWERWSSRAAVDYQIEVAWSQWGPYPTSEWVRVQVRDGQVESARYVRTDLDSMAVSEYPARGHTVDEVFAHIREMSRDGITADIEVEFDTGAGFPVRAAFRLYALDGDHTVRFRNLTALPQ